jgi:cell wall-associated NlpC family hydrolase
MKSLNTLIAVISLFLLAACGTTMHGDREPEPELYYDSQDFYDSLLTEMAYTPAQGKLIDYGRTLLGRHYNLGGATPGDGFDCSGFTKYVYVKALGLRLPRTAREMAASGKPVYAKEDLIAGDLVFFNLLGYDYSHVGIYIGNGRFFHASTNKGVIVIGNMKNEYFAKRYNGARRVLS